MSARAVQPLLEHTPLISWLYSILNVDGVSRLIGVAELTIAGLIFRSWSARVPSLGSLGFDLADRPSTGQYVTVPSPRTGTVLQRPKRFDHDRHTTQGDQ